MRSCRYVVACLAVSCLAAGCSTSKPKSDNADHIVGTPPKPKEDPFFFVAMPADAVPAQSSGTIGSDGDEKDKKPEKPENTEEVKKPEKAEKPERSEKAPDADADHPKAHAEVGARVEPASPEKKPPPSHEVNQCFSCVKICPLDADPGTCPGNEDVICGWGAGPDVEVAKTRATAECDGALDMARDMPRWSRIEGDCPIASCR